MQPALRAAQIRRSRQTAYNDASRAGTGSAARRANAPGATAMQACIPLGFNTATSLGATEVLQQPQIWTLGLTCRRAECLPLQARVLGEEV